MIGLDPNILARFYVEDPDPVFRIDELAVHTGIRDLAENIDHYLYDHLTKSWQG